MALPGNSPAAEDEAGERAENYVKKYCREMGLYYDPGDARTLAIYLAFKAGFIDRGRADACRFISAPASERSGGPPPDPQAA